ncbi:MAG: tetratricopeptide repeat protein [Promethearchaeota archaeon]|jgi:tetratricopeptide (TPR) repeat protein
MTLLLPKELAHARELIDQAKFDKAFEIVENFEKTESLPPKDQLSTLLIKGKIYLYKQRTRKALQTFNIAYQISQDLGLIPESVEVLIGKAYIGFIGDLDSAESYISDAERKLSTLDDTLSSMNLKRELLLIKSWVLFFKGNNRTVDSAYECLKLSNDEKIRNKLDLARVYNLLGWIDAYYRDRTKALDYAMKSLERNQDLNYDIAIATDYSLIARIYRIEGEYDKALEYCEKSLTITEITKRDELEVIWTLSQVYYLKSEFNKVVKYLQKGIKLSEELNITDLLIRNLNAMGYYYRVIGENNQGVEYFERVLTLSEKWGLIVPMAQSLTELTLTYIDEKLREKANRYLSRLTELYNQTKEKGEIDIYNFYLISKAYMMKTSTRMRDRVEAQALFRKAIDLTWEDGLIFSMGNLCDLLLEELSMYNDPEIIDEIVPLITKSLEMAEEVHNYTWLAETKLLQSKLALIQMKFEDAEKLMIEAQHIADLHGLNLLAWGISSEHDKLLEQVEVWDEARKEETPISQRIKLASTSDVLERIKGRRAVDTPESVEEQSTVLLILAEGGVLVFSYPFSDEWRIDEDLFSSFLSAFTSFSSEFFSKGLDRVKFGDDMMLMESIGSFSFCYLFKGQTYLARKKLDKFTEEVQNNTSLWQSLKQHYNSSQILEVKNSPYLESLIKDIFIS